MIRIIKQHVLGIPIYIKVYINRKILALHQSNHSMFFLLDGQGVFTLSFAL